MNLGTWAHFLIKGCLCIVGNFYQACHERRFLRFSKTHEQISNTQALYLLKKNYVRKGFTKKEKATLMASLIKIANNAEAAFNQKMCPGTQIHGCLINR
jgi:hypothetical protein